MQKYLPLAINTTDIGEVCQEHGLLFMVSGWRIDSSPAHFFLTTSRVKVCLHKIGLVYKTFKGHSIHLIWLKGVFTFK